MTKPSEVIPEGLYCYTRTDESIDPCPYWDKVEDRPDQCNGYCHFLDEGDWDVDGLSLLWDQVKECGENLGDDDEWI